MTLKKLSPCLMFALLGLMLLVWAVAGVAFGQTAIQPGLYQPEDRSATCELSLQNDGSWRMRLWQGESLQSPGQGFSFMGRFLMDVARSRLTGTWQALPGSCCPGRGRGEMEVLSPQSFRFAVFAPSMDKPAWPVLPAAEFRWVAPETAGSAGARLAGGWRLTMWYTDLLPGGAPADQVEGSLKLETREQEAAGPWIGRPGEVVLSPLAWGTSFIYRDPAAGFEISATLSSNNGGLSYGGPFQSTMGRGRLTMVRSGLPADPPEPQAQAAGELSGTWVDTRTGSDFFDIKGSPKGFDFTAYGGSLAHPRYLSRGRAQPTGEKSLEGQAKDEEGQCCGNQGRLLFNLLSPESMELKSFWWPQGQPDPGTPEGEPYVIKRVQSLKAAGDAALTRPAGWPYIQPNRAGLLAPAEGALKVRFTWRPEGPPRDYTLFSQGGFQRDFDLFINSQGRLAARLATEAGPVAPASELDVTPNMPHEAWLIYQAGGLVQLYLDGRQAAQQEMTQPWRGSRSPYIIGASRWPGREFAGDIESVELWDKAQDPGSPLPPTQTITPPTPAAEPAQQAAIESPAPAPEAKILPLVRLWHPKRLIHAYAVKPDEIARFVNQGFVRQGPIGGILAQPEPGTKELWAFSHRGQGYTVLALSPAAPPGCDSLGLLGHVWPLAQPETTPIYRLTGLFPEPLRGGRAMDLLYTSRRETLPAAQEVGYREPEVLAYIKPAQEPAFEPPLLYNWQGSWRGEGWGRFFITRRGNEIFIFWYYGRITGPHYFGRYQLSPDGRRAEGIALGPPGPKANYYRQTLIFDTQADTGPRIRLTSWRLAGPLDDGRLVQFKKPQFSETLLKKTAQAIPAQEVDVLNQAMEGHAKDPSALLERAVDDAKRGGRLLER